MTTYYIDPSSSTNGTGTISDPFNTWASVTWAAGNSYLQKAGTTFNGKITVSTGGSSETTRVILGKYQTGPLPIINGKGFDRGIQIPAGQHYITVQDFEILGQDTGTRRGIAIGSTDLAVSNNCIIERCLIHDLIATTSDANGISCFGSNTIIRDNTICNIPTDGIWLSGTNCSIYRNRISQVGLDVRLAGDCIQVYGNANLGCGGTEVYQNYLDHSNGSFKQCVIVQDQGTGSGCKIYLNRCVMASYDGITNNNTIFTDIPNAQVFKNTIIGGRYGIFNNRENSSIFSNLISFSDYGVAQAPSVTGINITNNVINNCTSYGVYLDTDTTAVCKNNVVMNCTTGVAMETGSGEDNNCYFNNGTDRATLGGVAAWGTSLFTNPLLNTSFRPKSSSPLIAAGTFNYLQDKNSTTFWTTPSIGAYEYMRPRAALTQVRTFR